MSDPAARTLDSADDFQRLLNDPSTPREVLVSLQAPAEVWCSVLERYPDSAAWVAANHALPRSIVERLAMDSKLAVRAALASSAALSDELMMELAHDKSELIRLRVVCNLRATREVLRVLSGDACQLVSTHAQARLVHDISGVALPPSYLDDVEVLDLLH